MTTSKFWSRVTQVDDCWVWTGRTFKGYGQVAIGSGKTEWAHRYSYQQMVAEIPEGLVLDHLCRNKLCVNPYHLEPVTQRVNVLRAHQDHRRTECKQEHPYTPENTYRRRDRPQAQVCRICDAKRQAAYKARKKEISKP